MPLMKALYGPQQLLKPLGPNDGNQAAAVPKDQDLTKRFPFVIRRVESMNMIGRHGDERHVSLDIDARIIRRVIRSVGMLPSDDVGPKEFLLPIALFNKGILIDFDAKDSHRNLNLASRQVSYAAGFSWLFALLPENDREKVGNSTTLRQIIWDICRRDANTLNAPEARPGWIAYLGNVHHLLGIEKRPSCQDRRLWRRIVGPDASSPFALGLLSLWDDYIPMVVVRKKVMGKQRHLIKIKVIQGQMPESFAHRAKSSMLDESGNEVMANSGRRSKESQPRSIKRPPRAISFFGKPVIIPVTMQGSLEGHCEHTEFRLPKGVENLIRNCGLSASTLLLT
ncbi:MAG: hypothetical protein LBV30_08635 [Propionibacteriaceae bacterium]|jgi:hypothetical protein|nr:hypothetical protein [Propionibacteriaceae bacterium]